MCIFVINECLLSESINKNQYRIENNH